MPAPPPGLCGACQHARVITTGRGGRFWLCQRSTTDPRFPRYPALPIVRCPGFQPGEVVDPRRPTA
jgi:hypothetical protein